MTAQLSAPCKCYTPVWYHELRERVLSGGVEPGIEEALMTPIKPGADSLPKDQRAHLKAVAAPDELRHRLGASARATRSVDRLARVW